jgi:REP element-mobilizing transposase RayT
MTSPPPLLYDAYYHIYNRGTNRENIFIEDRNYEYFLNLYARHIDPFAELFAYCLLKNHFHMLVRVKSEDEIIEYKKTLKVSPAINQPVEKSLRVSETLRDLTPEKPLGSDYPSKKFSDLFNAYAKAINKAYNRTGSLFQHPFGRVLVTSDRQFWNVIAYIHQNPQKHKFVDDFRDWKYSSYGIMLADDPTRVQRDAVLDWFGGKEQYLELNAEWVSDAQSKWFAEDDFD